jgi:hypothetical protein
MYNVPFTMYDSAKDAEGWHIIPAPSRVSSILLFFFII